MLLHKKAKQSLEFRRVSQGDRCAIGTGALHHRAGMVRDPFGGPPPPAGRGKTNSAGAAVKVESPALTYSPVN